MAALPCARKKWVESNNLYRADTRPSRATLVGLRRQTSADPPQIILNEVYIGRAKDSLDLVDFDLIIEEVVPAFGRFVKFAVGHKEVSF